MTRIVEADETGAVHLDREMLGSRPGTKYTVDLSADQVVLKPVAIGETAQKRLWEILTPEERAEEFLQWARRQPPSEVHLTDEQLRRENLYD